MSKLRIPEPGFLVASFLYRHDLLSADQLMDLWAKRYPKSGHHFTHPHFPMKSYYSKEMGPEDKLSRFFFVCDKLFPREELVEAKIWATHLEQELCYGPQKRSLNLDIGLLVQENLSLGTGKNYVHRTYLRQGVFSDLTLFYQNESYQTLSWTYPDYAHPEVIDFFNRVRKDLRAKLKAHLLASNSTSIL